MSVLCGQQQTPQSKKKKKDEIPRDFELNEYFGRIMVCGAKHFPSVWGVGYAGVFRKGVIYTIL